MVLVLSQARMKTTLPLEECNTTIHLELIIIPLFVLTDFHLHVPTVYIIQRPAQLFYSKISIKLFYYSIPNSHTNPLLLFHINLLFFLANSSLLCWLRAIWHVISTQCLAQCSLLVGGRTQSLKQSWNWIRAWWAAFSRCFLTGLVSNHWLPQTECMTINQAHGQSQLHFENSAQLNIPTLFFFSLSVLLFPKKFLNNVQVPTTILTPWPYY